MSHRYIKIGATSLVLVLAFVGLLWSTLRDGVEYYKHVDEVVASPAEWQGKPRDDAEAAEMLKRLSGRWHQVMTGVSVRVGAQETGRVEVTAVEFSALSADEVAWYVASGEGRDKAGAYAIQGLASRFIPSISGSYSNVVGLPVSCVAELLHSLLASRR